jgi:hypothetical protein
MSSGKRLSGATTSWKAFAKMMMFLPQLYVNVALLFSYLFIQQSLFRPSLIIISP